jgi:hypothetical protein
MEHVLDFFLGIRWWQWLGGTASVAGLYYLVAGVVLPQLKRLRAKRSEETALQEQERARKEQEKTQEEREAARRECLKSLPSGPVEPVSLPQAFLRIKNRIVPLPRNAEVTFGTKRGVSIQIMARGVSREHAKIRPEPRGYVLYDLMSNTGTFVGGKQIESKVLEDGDAIRVGTVEISFTLGEAPQE